MRKYKYIALLLVIILICYINIQVIIDDGLAIHITSSENIKSGFIQLHSALVNVAKNVFSFIVEEGAKLFVN